jgi:DNA-binding NtrC family response regulator
VLQSRLLRVLQEREVRRVGENVAIHVNVRVLAATNESLEERMKEGAFREDLYYRLNVIPIALPALRERLEDVPLLVAHFLRDRVHARLNKNFQVTREAMHALSTYDWPGNIRELQNAIERACALADTETIRLEVLPPNVIAACRAKPASPELHATDTTLFQLPNSRPDAKPAQLSDFNGSAAEVESLTADLKTYVREQELSYINQAITRCSGDKEKAATLLGISMATLYRRLSADE